MDKTVVALYDNLEDARMAVEELIREGYINENISLITRDEGGEYSRYVGETKVEEGVGGALAGAGAGAALGGIGGLLLGVGALAIPGIGPIVAAGPIAAALAGAGIGAAVGGILGALIEAGIPEEEAQYYTEGIESGGTLVTVDTSEEMATRARDILNRHNPSDLNRTGSAGGNTYVPSHMVATDFGEYEPIFRSDYDRNYAYTGRSWDLYRPAYYYGYELASDARYRDRTWSEIEADARRDWEQRYGDTLWDDIKDAVRSAWDTITGRR